MNDKPRPVPPDRHSRFLDVELPEHFIVEVVTDAGSWVAGNGYLRADCHQAPTGEYVCGHRSGGSSQWIRCVAHLPDSFIHLDGGGRSWRYRLVPQAPPSDLASEPE